MGALSTAAMQSWRGRELPSRSGLQAVEAVNVRPGERCEQAL